MDAAARFIERTLVLIKPDGVTRGLSTDILHRFERAGLKIVGLKMVWVTKDHVAKHYPDDRTELMITIGNKTLESYQKYELNAKELLGTDDPLTIGKMVNEWNKDYLSSGPVVAVVFEGVHAIENVRLMTGATAPTNAIPGTIRGDLSTDSGAMANMRKRAIRNLVHASGNQVEANYEINLWFTPEEIHSYKRSDEDAMYQ